MEVSGESIFYNTTSLQIQQPLSGGVLPRSDACRCKSSTTTQPPMDSCCVMPILFAKLCHKVIFFGNYQDIMTKNGRNDKYNESPGYIQSQRKAEQDKDTRKIERISRYCEYACSHHLACRMSRVGRLTITGKLTTGQGDKTGADNNQSDSRRDEGLSQDSLR